MSVGQICIREVDLVEQDECVQSAAQRMNSRNAGTLVVLDAGSHPVGILTDRDLAIRVVGKGLDPYATTVAEVMSTAPDSVREETSIETALSHMRSGPFRRLPVVDEQGQLVGIISLNDILELLTEEFAEIGQLIRSERPDVLAEP